MSETTETEKKAEMPMKSFLTLQIVAGAIFGALSLVLSFTAAFLPRTPVGLAYFDPVSVIWVICYFVFGPIAGLICCVIGMLTLMPFDPFAPIGPFMKFAATISLILPGIIIFKLYKREAGEQKSKKLKALKTFAIAALIGIAVRVVVMIGLNIVVYTMLGYPPEGLAFYLVFVVIINILQSVWDLVIPYIIVFGLKLDEKFQVW